jgi:membrane-associated protease RseP (regulator of RpoE activity)
MSEAKTADSEQDEEEAEDSAGPARPRYLLSAVLFVLTVISVFITGALWEKDAVAPESGDILGWLALFPQGWRFAVPLLAILIVHEMGHYITARLHGVDASLPLFIPAFRLSPFGTMGAVIAMRGRIRSRNALLDIGASGPLAGLVVAIPVLCVGIATSTVEPTPTGQYIQEGQSLLYWLLKAILKGPIPDGYDLQMNPIAAAGWTGLFVTALNLVPVGQLDGGHIAYALFGRAQNRYASWLHSSLLGVFAFNVIVLVLPAWQNGQDTSQPFANSTFWLVWFGLLWLMRRLARGQNHPPTDPGELSPGRKVIAGISLVFFIALFMPTPWALHGDPHARKMPTPALLSDG